MSGSSTINDARNRSGTGSPTVVRSERARLRRRRRHILVGALIGTFAILAGLIGFGLYRIEGPQDYATPAHATADATGIVAGGTGRVKVDVYVDYQCPACRTLQAQAGTVLDRMIAKNQITLVYHPMAFLDGMSSTAYSTRAAASTGCAADMGEFLAYTRDLFARQPAAHTAGLTDDQLVQIGGKAGIINPAFAMCVRDGTYRTWVAHVTGRAGDDGVVGAPTIEVNGVPVAAAGSTPTAAELTAAVTAALG